MIKDICIITHASRSRVIDICIMHTCIMDTCIMHAYIMLKCIMATSTLETCIGDTHYGQTHNGYMYPGYIHPGYMHHEYLHPTPRIALFVRPSVRWSQKNPASWLHAPGSRIIYSCIKDTCIMQIFIGIKDHRYVHHTYMHQGQGSRIIDTCNIHMGQFLQGGKNPCFVSLFFLRRAFVWPNHAK